MHDALIADAARPARVSILKLPMLDYSIGHELILWQRRNPFVTYTSSSFNELPFDDQAKALNQAVLVCCERLPQWPRWWAWGCRKLDKGAEMAKFREYREAGSLDLPVVKMPRTPGAHFHYFGSPETGVLINYVSEHHQAMIAAHFDGSPLNFPFGLARILYMTYQEGEGHVWVENYHDWQVKQRRAAYERAHPESGLAIGDEAVQVAAEKWNAEHPESPAPLMRNNQNRK